MVSYRQGNEERTGDYIIQAVNAGRSVALCSDGGYPGISDPGYRLIRRAAQEKVAFDVLPGASAVDLALLFSGLSTSSFTFKGFPPRKPGALRRFFEEEKSLPHTLICFESPFRIAPSLKAALEVLGDREAAVCIELTKAHERIDAATSPNSSRSSTANPSKARSPSSSPAPTPSSHGTRMKKRTRFRNSRTLRENPRLLQS
jgi:16S rRNA (cytidine1402-2'-O)-methyltransferase